MNVRTYRIMVIGSLLSSFLVGLHMPQVHEVIDHGATPGPAPLIATAVLVVLTIAGAWTLLTNVPRR